MISKADKIENLELSARAINALQKCNIYRVSDLMNLDLHKIRYSGGVGKKTFAEIVNYPAAELRGIKIQNSIALAADT